MHPQHYFGLLCSLLALTTIACTPPQQQLQSKTISVEVSDQTIPDTLPIALIDYPDNIIKINKSSEEWQRVLDPQAYYVLRKAGTERAFTGTYWDNKTGGVYTCAACSLPLFSSDTKFKSGTGWPSFYQPIRDNYVTVHIDNAFGMRRTEVLCARCDGHLGHVFEDGPPPTHLRYCINSASLNFIKK